MLEKCLSKEQRLLEKIIDRDAYDLAERMAMREKYAHKTFAELEKIWENNK